MGDALSTYLVDHEAGSTAAVQLLQRKAPDDPFAATLLAEVNEDVATLRAIMAAVGTEPSAVKSAGAWVGEQVSRVKLAAGAMGDDRIRPLQELEFLQLGIEGKHALWRALGEAQPNLPALAGFDFPALAARARDQVQRVDERRLAAARAALT